MKQSSALTNYAVGCAVGAGVFSSVESIAKGTGPMWLHVACLASFAFLTAQYIYRHGVAKGQDNS